MACKGCNRRRSKIVSTVKRTARAFRSTLIRKKAAQQRKADHHG